MLVSMLVLFLGYLFFIFVSCVLHLHVRLHGLVFPFNIFSIFICSFGIFASASASNRTLLERLSCANVSASSCCPLFLLVVRLLFPFPCDRCLVLFGRLRLRACVGARARARAGHRCAFRSSRIVSHQQTSLVGCAMRISRLASTCFRNRKASGLTRSGLWTSRAQPRFFVENGRVRRLRACETGAAGCTGAPCSLYLRMHGILHHFRPSHRAHRGLTDRLPLPPMPGLFCGRIQAASHPCPGQRNQDSMQRLQGLKGTQPMGQRRGAGRTSRVASAGLGCSWDCWPDIGPCLC